MDKWVVLDDILPILEKINVKDSALLMAILGIYKIVLTHPKLGITKDLLATRVIPFLVPITIDSSLNMKQVAIIKIKFIIFWIDNYKSFQNFLFKYKKIIFLILSTKFTAYMSLIKEMLAHIEVEQ